MLFKKKKEKGFQKFVEFTSTFSREDNPLVGMGGVVKTGREAIMRVQRVKSRAGKPSV